MMRIDKSSHLPVSSCDQWRIRLCTVPTVSHGNASPDFPPAYTTTTTIIRQAQESIVNSI